MNRKIRVYRAAIFSFTFIVTAAIMQTICWTVAASPAPQSSQLTAGEKLVKTNDCISCHAVNHKLVGPAYVAVAKRYHGKPGAVAKLMAKIKAGGSGDWGQVPMTPHPTLTKAQLKAMVEWILSLAGKPAGQTAASPAPSKEYTYTLPDGKAAKVDVQLFVEGSNQKVTKDIFHGYELYNSYCYRCHGQDATGSEIAPDLRRSLGSGMTEQQFMTVAMAGRQEKGMPSWAGFLDEQEVRNIYGYVKGRSLDLIPVGRPPSEMD